MASNVTQQASLVQRLQLNTSEEGWDTKLLTIAEWLSVIREYPLEDYRSPFFMVAFGGDRLTCCTHINMVYKVINGQLLIGGFASISPQGENYDGTPTIVGFMINRQIRRNRLGRRLLLSTMDEMKQMGMPKVHIDSLTEAMHRTIAALPQEYKDRVDESYLGNIL